MRHVADAKSNSHPLEDAGGPRRKAGAQLATPRRMSRLAPRSLLLVAAVLTGASCGHGHLAPGEDAQLVPSAATAAVAIDAGVRVVASLSDWRGTPMALPDQVTPIKIRVVNHGKRPVSILYEHFSLAGRRSRHYQVVPAIPLAHATLLAGMGPIQPIFATSNFEVAARYHDIYPSLDVSPSPLPRERQGEASAATLWATRAPNREVCRMELPEGVLGPGGEITGYLYFEDPTRSEKSLMLVADFVAQESGDKVASIKIPLRVE
jgi:hypothetical protein